MLIPFLKYYLKAETKYGIHSPYVFDFIDQVLEDDRNYYAFDHLEALRNEYLNCKDSIEVVDLGSGSKKMKGSRRKINTITKNSVTGPKLSEFLFRLSKWKRPQTILELGTSLGLSISYLASAVPDANTITLEGCPNTSAWARGTINKMGLKNVQILEGHFQDTLPEAIRNLGKLDMVFIDGHHAKEPTLDYWEQIKPNLRNEALIIFDDIHWSKGMEEAWEQVIHEPAVSLSIDLFYKGIVVWKKNGMGKANYKLIHSKWKPWKTGLWG